MKAWIQSRRADAARSRLEAHRLAWAVPIDEPNARLATGVRVRALEAEAGRAEAEAEAVEMLGARRAKARRRVRARREAEGGC